MTTWCIPIFWAKIIQLFDKNGKKSGENRRMKEKVEYLKQNEEF